MLKNNPNPAEAPTPLAKNLAKNLAAGIGLRTPHHADVLAEKPAIGWVEVHSENLFSRAPFLWQDLQKITEHYPLSLHGIGLSLGSTEGVNPAHLAQLKEMVAHWRPALVSDHVSWSGATPNNASGASSQTFVPDLLPLPFTQEAVDVLSRNITHVQNTLGRQILVENPSAYMAFTQADFDEPEFLAQLVASTGCGLILDVNNIAVSAHNVGGNPPQFVEKLASLIPAGTVQEIHVAGYHVNQLPNGQEMWIDTHSTPVYPAVWELYETALTHLGDVNTLVEWDADIPSLTTLLAEAQKADEIRRRVAAETGATPATPPMKAPQHARPTA